MSIIEEVRKFLLEVWPATPAEFPLELPSPLVVGVSGGPDSLALLNVLIGSDLVGHGSVVVAHLDHGLRPESAEEARFVANVARDMGVVFHHEQFDVAALAKEQGLSTEEAGRVARYRFLAGVARKVGARSVATGHQADDQAETVLMHFLRGSGLAGMRGMLPIGRVPGAPDLTLIRPLLFVTREEIEAYCHEQGLEPREDPTNRDLSIYRNRLRHELLPLLERYKPGIKERLGRTASIAAADYAVLRQLVAEAWSGTILETGPEWLAFKAVTWRELPLALRRATLREAVRRLRPDIRDVGFVTLEQARKVADAQQVGAQAALPEGVALTVGYDRLIVTSAGLEPAYQGLPQLPDAGPRRLEIPGHVDLENNWRLSVAPVDGLSLSQIEANQDRWQAYVSAAVCPSLEVRGRKKGERFQPLGMGGRSAKVSAVMVNRKIPAALRERWPIVAGPDHLVWLAGHHIDRRARLTAGDQPALLLKMRRISQVDLP